MYTSELPIVHWGRAERWLPGRWPREEASNRSMRSTLAVHPFVKPSSVRQGCGQGAGCHTLEACMSRQYAAAVALSAERQARWRRETEEHEMGEVVHVR
jgi:hypothetical protein